VAIHSRNSITATMFCLACFRAGLIAVPISARVKGAELVYLLRHSQARICFSDPALASCLDEALPQCDGVQEFLDRLPDLEAFGDGHLPDVDPDAAAIILYTSGTTARPKGVVHSHRTVSEAIRKLEPWGLDSTHTVLVITPATHIMGLFAQLLAGLRNDATVVLLPAFDAASALDAIERRQVSMIVGLPVMMQMLMAEQRARPRNAASLRFACAGGDVAAIAVHEAFTAIFGIPLLGGYAMTETLPICANRTDAWRAGALGTPAPGVEVRLSGPDGSVEAGAVGEVLVRSSANFVGYWNDPDATAAAFRDGWLHTGDLARQDGDGYYWFEGRTKELIVRGGSNVSPQEVEDALYRHPAVFEAGAVGQPDAMLGERVVACVALRPGQVTDEDALRSFVRRILADYKVPEQIVFLPVLPKGPTGKIDRRGLKQMLAEMAAVATLESQGVATA
jgi:long-chain acyl-CoA synthetase